MIRRYLMAAASGSMAAGTAFVLVHYALFGNDPARHAEGFTLDSMLLITSMGLGALAGAVIGGPMGSVRLNKVFAGFIRGALWGVAATSLLGLASSSAYRPKAAEEHKASWLFYGLPCGALIGALGGAILAIRTPLKPADGADVGRTSLDRSPLP